MQYREFGQTGLATSAIGFGAASISGEGAGYGFGDISRENAISLVRYAFECGINIFDTAPIYGFGESERRLGEALRPFRDKSYIVSKSGVSWHANKRVDMNNDPKIAQKMLEQSLRDLQTDYIDIYMVHWPDPRFDIRSTLEVHAKAQIQGKIKYIGLCNTNTQELALAREVCEIDVLQMEYSLNAQNNFEDFKEESIATMGWGSFDKGILTGRVTEDRIYDKSDARSWAPWWNQKQVLAKINKVKNLKKQFPEIELRDMALHFALSGVDCALVGMRSIEQVDSLFKSLQVTIDEDTLLAAQELMS